ncbi:MAG: TVP38/TMEM64 family protein [Gemmatimonadota bacterium]
MTSRFSIRLVVLALLVAAGVGAAVLLPLEELLGRFFDRVRVLGAWGPVLLAAAYVPASLLFVPGSVLTLGAGFLFGLGVGTVAVSAGSVMGACAAFLVGRTLARGAVERRVVSDPRFRAIDDAVARQGFRIVLLTRLSPIFPFTLLNYAYGVTPVSFRDYVLASWLGMLPGTVLYVYLGTAARSLAQLLAGDVESGTGGKVFLALGLVATVAVTALVTRTARRALREAARPEAARPETPRPEATR